jgi:hypothetical protein
MKISNLDTKKYKRFFAFGCSFTNYIWLTWADIIGKEIEIYENWAEQSSGNYFIFNSFIEADARYDFNENDLVIIFWTTKEREDRYHNNQWIHATTQSQKKIYGNKWFKKFSLDYRSYLIRDLSYMKSVQTILKHKKCDWANFCWNEFVNSETLRTTFKTSKDKTSMIQLWKKNCKEIYNGGEIPAFIDDRDVIKLYQDVFINIDAVYKWFKDENIDTRVVPNNDTHPTPMEALEFLDWVWPNNNISVETREYVKQWEIKIFENHERPDRLEIIRL